MQALGARHGLVNRGNAREKVEREFCTRCGGVPMGVREGAVSMEARRVCSGSLECGRGDEYGNIVIQEAGSSVGQVGGKERVKAILNGTIESTRRRQTLFSFCSSQTLGGGSVALPRNACAPVSRQRKAALCGSTTKLTRLYEKLSRPLLNQVRWSTAKASGRRAVRDGLKPLSRRESMDMCDEERKLLSFRLLDYTWCVLTNCSRSLIASRSTYPYQRRTTHQYANIRHLSEYTALRLITSTQALITTI
ncbi:hypothetical protein Tco_0205172 [Tanacetum coccineum]